MSQITVRNVPEAVEARLRHLAVQTGSSLNQTVVRLLGEATGAVPTAGPKRDLTAFGSRWTAAECCSFDTAVTIFESLDAEVWL